MGDLDPIADHCRRVIERGSRSFTRASTMLEPEVRAGAYQLYAWCRYCDDVIDDQVMGHPAAIAVSAKSPADRLADLRHRTEVALRGGRDDELVFPAIARIVERYRIPRHHPFEFLDGMAMDVAGVRYRTLDELLVYCYRVAGVVAVMMAHIMGIRDAATLERAADLGRAMQLTNIARDVMDDARVGRVFLPLDWLAEAGVPPTEIAEPGHRIAVADVVRRMLQAAEPRYARADEGIDHLPFRSAWSITAARMIYARIGTVIVQRGPRAWDTRAVVPDWQKYLLLGLAFRRTAGRAFRR